MEHKLYTDNFERLLREQTDNFKMQPSKKVWQGIYNNVHPSRRLPSILMSLVLITSLLLLGYLNTRNNKSSNTTLADKANKTNTPLTPGSAVNSNTLNSNVGSAISDNTIPGDVNPANAPAAVNNQQSNMPVAVNSNNSSNSNPGTGSAAFTNRRYRIADRRGNTPQIDGALQAINAGADNNTSNTANTGTVSASVEQLTVVADNGLPVSVIMRAGAVRSKSTVTAGEPGVKEEGSNTTAEDVNGADYIDNNKTAVDNVRSIQPTGTPTGVEDKQPVTAKDKPGVAAAAKRLIPSKEDLAWMEDYALHNKQPRKRWKGRLDWQAYGSVGFTYRTLFDRNEYAVNTTNNTPVNRVNMNGTVSHKPGLHLEAGAAILYSVSKNLRFKTGLQLDYTNYYIYAYETTHPISTTITLADINTGIPIRHPRSSSLFNANGAGDAILNNSTYQLSVPLGLDLKLAGTDRLKWYAGATIQPTVLLGNNSFLLSSDHQNYIAENHLARKFNLNAGIETFASYKTGNYTLQFGPQVRYQLLSTNSQRYTNVEKLFSYGVKLGFIKAF